MRGSTRLLGLVPLVAASATCLGDAPRSEPIGAAQEADDCCIASVKADPVTVHFEGPAWLLASGEAEGPMLIDVRVVDFIIPAVSTSGSVTPKMSAISDAVGFNVEQRFGVQDFSRYTLMTGQFKRVEAYTNYQRFAFEIRDASCGAVIGSGAAYRPIGVYFKLVDAYDVALPDVHPVTFGPAPPPVPPPPPPILVPPLDAAAPGQVDAASGAPEPEEADAGDAGGE